MKRFFLATIVCMLALTGVQAQKYVTVDKIGRAHV